MLFRSDMLPIKEVTKKLCKALNIDPKKLISSGSMIMVVPEKNTQNLINDLENKGIKATVVGIITEKDIFKRSNGDLVPIPSPGSDELYRALNA